MKAYIESYGCSLNRGEALEIECILRSSGWEIADKPEDSNLIIIATCAVIETTEREMIRRVRILSRIGMPLIVTGCMASSLKSSLEPVAPEARFVEPSEYGLLFRDANVKVPEDWTPEPWPGTFCHTIPIASGCIGDCAYCITKIARGQLRSRSVESIVGEIGRIDFSQGWKEVQLAAQDSASYGLDFGGSLPSLMDSIGTMEGDFRVRVGMMNPSQAHPISQRLAEAFANDRFFKFLHLPLQSGSDKLLSEMNRRHTFAQFNEIVGLFRSNFPAMTLSTDIIVGYPGETVEDHESNIKAIEKALPDIVNITRFSARPGTSAFDKRPKVPGWIAKNRSRELTRLRFGISSKKNAKKVGSVVDVIVTEKGSKGTMIGRSTNYEQVILDDSMKLGERLNVEIVDSSRIHLIGRRIR